MPGFHKGACAKPKNYANGGFVPKSKRGGVIRGPGTGTSDSIQREIPEGSYIMPADSTQQIGVQALQQMGRGAPVPARVSNGEYQLTPEQVHAIGVQVLEQMKGATHTPVAEPRGFKPGLFFSDGGAVDELKKAFPSTAQAVSEYDPVGAYKTGGLPAAAGQTVRAVGTYTGGFLNDVIGRPLATAWDAAANTLKTAVTGDSTPIPADQTARGMMDGAGAAPAPSAVAAASQKPAATPSGSANAPAAPATTAAPAKPPASSVPPAAAGGVEPGADQAQLTNNIVKTGKNSYSGTNIGPDATLNGKPFGSAAGTVSSADNAAMQALSNRYALPDMARGAALAQAQPQSAVFHPNTGLADERLAESRAASLLSAASTPYAGSPNGQLTANQLRVLADIQNQDANRVTASANAAMHDATSRDLSAQNNTAAIQRALLNEAGLNQRFAATNALDQQKVDLAKEAQGFQTRALKRQEDLTAKWEAAKTPEEKSAIAQQIRALSGRSDAATWKPVVLQGGTDAMGNRTESVMGAVNEATGEMRRYDQNSQPLPPGMKKQVGTSGGKPVYEDANGKRFIGN